MKLPAQPKQYSQSFEQQRSGIIERSLSNENKTVLYVVDSVPAPGAASGVAQIYVDTADGDLKVCFANGTIKTLATNP